MSVLFKKMSEHQKRKNNLKAFAYYHSNSPLNKGMSMLNNKYIIKENNFFKFSYQKFVNQIPAGTYFPDLDGEYKFILKTARHNQPGSEVSEALKELAGYDNWDEEEASSIADAFENEINEAPIVKNGSYHQQTSSFSNNGRVTLRYMDQNYFPMEKYVTPFQELKTIIKAFIASKDFYTDKRLDYKRSILLYGDPGVGKTRFLANLADDLIVNEDAIVIRIESRKHLEHYFAGIPAINDFCKGRLKVVLVEELSELLRGRSADSDILNMLDSTLLKDDIIYLITTNYPESIPKNIIDRPSRIDDTIGVHQNHFTEEFIQAWYQHLMGEPFPEKDVNTGFISQMSGKYSPAYLKELFLRAYMRQSSLQDALEEIDQRRRNIRTAFRQKQDVGFM